MTPPDSRAMSAQQILDREFLEMRAKILEVAATLDRLERAEGTVTDDPRLAKLREGIETLLMAGPDRAERIQLIFSRPFVAQWRAEFQL